MFDLLPALPCPAGRAARAAPAGTAPRLDPGPPRADGRAQRRPVAPGQVLENPKTGDALRHREDHLPHGDRAQPPGPRTFTPTLSISRFPLMPVTYVPPAATARPARPSGCSPPKDSCAQPSRTRCWPPRQEGLLQGAPSPAVAVAARPGNSPQPGSPTCPSPTPEKVFTQPSAAAEEGSDPRLRPLQRRNQEPGRRHRRPRQILASTMAEREGQGPLADARREHRIRARRSHRGPRAAQPLSPSPPRAHRHAGSRATGPAERTYRQVRPAEHPDRDYTLELWTQSDLTREAVLAALEHHHQLSPAPRPARPSQSSDFTGDITLTSSSGTPAPLGSGIDRPPGKHAARVHLARAAR